jgi:hypothetical protein
MSRRSDMHARMVYLKNDGLLYHAPEIRKLRIAIDAMDRDREAENQASAERMAKMREIQKRNKPNLFWRIINWI